MRRFVLPLVALFMILQSAVGSELTGFRVCRMTEPAGIVRTAQFSWQTTSTKPNVMQMAYHLRVATSKAELKAGRNLLWDSGRTNSDESINVPYQGRRLPYQSRVFWQVEVWLNTGEHLTSPVQSFLTGIKQFQKEAQWIGMASTDPSKGEASPVPSKGGGNDPVASPFPPPLEGTGEASPLEGTGEASGETFIVPLYTPGFASAGTWMSSQMGRTVFASTFVVPTGSRRSATRAESVRLW